MKKKRALLLIYQGLLEFWNLILKCCFLRYRMWYSLKTRPFSGMAMAVRQRGRGTLICKWRDLPLGFSPSHKRSRDANQGVIHLWHLQIKRAIRTTTTNENIGAPLYTEEHGHHVWRDLNFSNNAAPSLFLRPFGHGADDFRMRNCFAPPADFKCKILHVGCKWDKN